MICDHWKSQARGVEAAANPLRITHFTAAAEHSSAKSPSFYSSAFRRSAGVDFVLQRAGPNRVRNVCEHFFQRICWKSCFVVLILPRGIIASIHDDLGTLNQCSLGGPYACSCQYYSSGSGRCSHGYFRGTRCAFGAVKTNNIYWDRTCGVITLWSIPVRLVEDAAIEPSPVFALGPTFLSYSSLNGEFVYFCFIRSDFCPELCSDRPCV